MSLPKNSAHPNNSAHTNNSAFLMPNIEDVKKFFFPNSFEPISIRYWRTIYTIFSYICCIGYFIYIIYSVVSSPVVVAGDGGETTLANYSVPHVYFFYYNVSSYPLIIGRSLAIDVAFIYSNRTIIPSACTSCISTNQGDPLSLVFKGDTLMYSEEYGIEEIVFRINYPTPVDLSNSSSSGYDRDHIQIHLQPSANDEYDSQETQFSALRQNSAGKADQNFINDASLNVYAGEMLSLYFGYTNVDSPDQQDGGDKFLNHVGIYTETSQTVQLNVVAEFHQNTDPQVKSIVRLRPTYVTGAQKATYSVTLINSIGSLSAIMGLFGLIGVFLFGAKRLKIFGLLHRSYLKEYKDYIQKKNVLTDLTFEKAKDAKFIANDWPELQLRMLANWFD